MGNINSLIDDLQKAGYHEASLLLRQKKKEHAELMNLRQRVAAQRVEIKKMRRGSETFCAAMKKEIDELIEKNEKLDNDYARGFCTALSVIKLWMEEEE